MGFWQRDRLVPGWAAGPMLGVRILVGAALAAAAGFSAFVLLFVGTVVATDCFFDCGGDPRPVAGGALLLMAAASGGVGLAALWFAAVDRWWPVAWRLVPAVVVVAATALVLVTVTA